MYCCFLLCRGVRGDGGGRHRPSVHGVRAGTRVRASQSVPPEKTEEGAESEEGEGAEVRSRVVVVMLVDAASCLL